jgi:O-antigen/teichoic acid export membrane protein
MATGTTKPRSAVAKPHIASSDENDLAGPGLATRAVRGGAAMLSAQIAVAALGLISTVVLARLLTPADFGLIAMAATALGFLSVMKDLGLSQATIQRKSISENQVAILFYVNLGFSLLLMAATVALAPLVANFYGAPELFGILVVLAATFVVAGLSAQHHALLQRSMRYNQLATIAVASAAVGIASGIGGALAGVGYWALVMMQIASLCSACLGYWLVSGWRPGLPRRDPEVRQLLVFGGDITGFSIVNYFARNADNVLIGWCWGAAPLGLYSRAYALFLAPIQQINGPLSSVLLPTLSRLNDDPGRYRRVFLRVLEKVLMITAPLAGLMIATTDWIVAVLLGPNWAPAAGILAWLAIAALTQPASHLAGALFISQGRTRELLRWGIIGSGLSTISFVVGLPFGPAGVAACYAVSGLLIRTPILFAMVGATGPVSAFDLYRAAAAPILSGLAVFVGIHALRVAGLLPEGGLGLASAVALTPLLGLMGMAMLPLGRSALRDALDIGRVAFGFKATPL